MELTLVYAGFLLLTNAEINRVEISFNNKCSHIGAIFV